MSSPVQGQMLPGAVMVNNNVFIREEQANVYVTRIDRFIQVFSPTILSQEASINVPLNVVYSRCPTDKFVPWEQKDTLSYTSIKEGEKWGETWETAWFKFSYKLNSSFANKHVVCEINLNGEALLFKPDGTIRHGLTDGSVFDPNYQRAIVHMFPKATGTETIELWAQASCNGLFGVDHGTDPAKDDPHRYGYRDGLLNRARVKVFYPDRFALRCDMVNLYTQMQSMGKNSVGFHKILYLLSEVVDMLTLNPADTATPLAKIQAFYATYTNNGFALTACSTGHAHIDTAWLWPMDETVRKVARTFSSQLDLIDRYPGYVFGASVPFHHHMLKTWYPALNERLKTAVKNKRWELQGGMFVENDGELVGGESYIRQFQAGKRFFKTEYGVVVDGVHLPDSFGYSAALPQIASLCGCTHFTTQKLCWCQFNTFPYHTFVWRGNCPDPSAKLLTHFPPDNTYNSDMKTLRSAADRLKEKGLMNGFLVLFGVGDGGGGPHEEMCELAVRQRNALFDQPRVQTVSSKDFYDTFVEPVANALPEYRGELYLELHRGTLTTQARTKLRNRLFNYLLPEIETLHSVLTGKMSASVQATIMQQLQYLWRVALVHHFHDVLPGSCITRVYQDANGVYADVYERVKALICSLMKVIVGSTGVTSVQAGTNLFLVNPTGAAINRFMYLPLADANATVTMTFATPHTARDIVPAGVGPMHAETPDKPHGPWQSPFAPEPKILPSPSGWVSHLSPDNAPVGVLACANLPPYSIGIIDQAATARATRKWSVPRDEIITMENALVRYRIDTKTGQIKSADVGTVNFINESRPGNVFDLFWDKPNDWDAWDIDVFARRTRFADAVIKDCHTVIKTDAMHVVECSGTIGKASTFKQRLMLKADSPALYMETFFDWHEKHCLLKVKFPVTFVAADLRCDISVGYVERPTNTNTSVEAGMFEANAHEYAALHSRDMTFAILNNCKYGHSWTETSVELSLLRSPTNPDPDADQGHQWFTYAILPVCASVDVAMPTIVAHAHSLNAQPLVCTGPAVTLPQREYYPVTVEAATGSEVRLMACKKCERLLDVDVDDSKERVLVRVVEGKGMHATANIRIVADGNVTVRPVDPVEFGFIGPPFSFYQAPVTAGVLRSVLVPIALNPFQVATYTVEWN